MIEKVARVGMALCQNALGSKRCRCAKEGVFKCADAYPGYLAKAAIEAMAVQAEPVAWRTPLGGLIEARQIAQQAYKDIEREKSINGHIAGNPYDVALSALNSVLGCLAVLVDPTPPAAGGSDAE